ncbi:DNA-binding transcriptional regulator, LysR family [Ruegeria halocynthiae]|uniref:DNA-binding transcriptional regulator, LysR family n=1 Tax=Ruegeria halocynthiae TaxID=985054 RepID=A0A1H3CJY2_9RHOB|nr:LysR substrate-binding domain-containing protein [Ruegeria halocynthiae]SDX54396.1 DNA-binding transcriptional regulator, LysR family [Ruegeria halocynthiae]
MIAPRRFLPSISSLLALEAVDRLGSASAAAAELSLTQSAISRQLKTMEDQLGVQLIERSQMRLHLTPAAKDYVQIARSAVQELAQAALKLKANPAGGSLNLSILPAFGMHWLAPRLQDFARRHPEVTVNLGTRLKPFDFNLEPFDGAIHFGQQDWAGVYYLPLMREEVLPVCAPTLATTGFANLDALSSAPLLHLESRPDAWERWFEMQGHAAVGLRGMLFDQFSTMIQATIHGLGVALLPFYLVQDDLRTGRLVSAWGGPRISLGSYYLVWPNDRSVPEPLRSFRDWINDQLEADAGH